MFGRFSRNNVLYEPDIAEACVQFIADRLRCMPEDVVIELLYHPEGGFGAHVTVQGVRERTMQQLDIIDAIQEYIAETEHFSFGRSNVVHVELQFSERDGVYAEISRV